MKQKIGLVVVLLNVLSLNANAGGLDLARSIVCSRYPMAVSVALNGGTKAPGDLFSGSAVYNYESVRFEKSDCEANDEIVKCTSRWATGSPAELTVSVQEDGTYKGRLTIRNKTIVLGCLPSYNPLH